MSRNGEDTPTIEEIKRELEGLRRKFGDNVRFNIYQPGATRERRPGPDDMDDTPLDFFFDHRPRDIKTYLDRYVIKQDEAKKALAIAICDHYNHALECERNPKLREEDYTKQNILLVGPTGVGKTYLVRNIAKLIGVPFVKADATKFSETGYVGGNVEDLIRDLVTQADGDVRLASYGIVYLDEIDKIATPPNVMGRDVSGRGVQMNLLKLLEDTDVDLRSPLDIGSQIQAAMDLQKGKARASVINTRNILFIVSGAFVGLKDIIQKRLRKSRLGFGAELSSRDDEANYFPLVSSQDFIEFGFEPEFVGRLPVRVACHDLQVDDLFTILRSSEGSIVRQYERAFKAYGLEALFSQDGLKEVAQRAYLEKTGARGLVTVLERTLRDYKFELPSTEVKAFVVSPAVVCNPAVELERVMQDAEYTRKQVALERLHRYETEYYDRHALRLTFAPAAAAEICARACARGVDPKVVCEELFRSYEHGLSLIQKNTGTGVFTVEREALDDPDGTLERWVRESFAAKAKESYPAAPTHAARAGLPAERGATTGAGATNAAEASSPGVVEPSKPEAESGGRTRRRASRSDPGRSGGEA